MEDFLGTAIQHSELEIKRLEQEYALEMEQTAERLIASGFLDSDYDGSSGELSDAPSTEYTDSDAQDDDDFLDDSASTEDLFGPSVGSTEEILEPIGDTVNENQTAHPQRTQHAALIDMQAASRSYSCHKATTDEADECGQAESKSDSGGDDDELYASSECEEIEENVPVLVYALSATAYDEDRKQGEHEEDVDCSLMYFDEEEQGKAEEAIFELLNSESLQIGQTLIVIDSDDKIYQIINAYFK
eukprot:CAMPEP_0197037170 /NCGR_PEP_ID=MMETSP1384-20130603/14443_1 /TAXON_ID=29189 /ORGANISM="Ammonia sp." /LENGTH=244 /DNA_ID=CAMNT_0042467435 /DNA_START=36 /DNA_END=770 /DNA_ORIENTATION=+